MSAPDLRQVRLRWEGQGLLFRGGPDAGIQIDVDGGGPGREKQGQAPMELLLMSLAGCMAIDVLMILEKSRVPVDSLEVETIGRRAETMPKRYESIQLVYQLAGPSDDDQPKLDRAIELSRDKFCSVLHTLDPGIELDIRVERL